MVTGEVQLLRNGEVLKSSKLNKKATVNIIKIDAENIDKGSFSFDTDRNGFFDTSTLNIALEKGVYKFEVFKYGYAIDSSTVKIDGDKKLKFQLKKIKEIRSRTYSENPQNEEVISSGSVSIQPPQL